MVEIKEDKSPLTEADKKANEYICNQLTSLYPEIPIISEENKNEEYENRSKYEFAWLIDPLDGTKEFISRNGEFTVNIGLIHLGVPVAGFVNIPCSGITYWAIK
jgi:3'(2'), 5'-bisphosphate nucleotidase